MHDRIKSQYLQRVFENWRLASRDSGQLPSFVSYHAIVREHAASSFLAYVEPGRFRFVSVGDRLTERLGRFLAGESVSDDADALFGSLKATYLRCVEQRAPCYEFLRCDFGDGQPGRFERLTLPFGDSPSAVSHVGGTVLFDGDPTEVLR